MYAGDEFYDDEITSGPIDPPVRYCSCPKRADDDQWERHEEGCTYRRMMEAIMDKGYPA